MSRTRKDATSRYAREDEFFPSHWNRPRRKKVNAWEEQTTREVLVEKEKERDDDNQLG